MKPSQFAGVLTRALIGIMTLVAVTTIATAADYVWRNVKIGGGGYIPGLVYSPIEKNVIYARTDMGGIYRWLADQKKWRPLEDAIAERNYQGIESIAPDPVEPGVVYAAVGTYHTGSAAIFRSADYGDHWKIYPVPFLMGGNEEGRDLSERLAVDPNRNSVLYFGSRHDGLQKSADKGKTWKQIAGFPHKGLGAPADWRSHAGVSFVIFQPQSGTAGMPTKTIFAAVADPGAHHLYRSDDAGQNWTPVAGEPDAALLPGQGKLSGDELYITYADGKGPYGVSKGAVFKLNVKTGIWTDITPPKKGAYMGLAVDAKVPGAVAVATLCQDGALGDSIYRTTDGGAHWTDLRAISARDVSAVPWLKWGHADTNFGWWITGLVIDPFDSTHISYTTGATIFDSADLGQPSMTWRPWVEGIEQTAVLNLISPPKGAPLLSGFGDIGGFTHFDLNQSVHMQTNPLFTNTNNYDYAEAAPNVIVRSGTHEPHASVKTATLGYSTDYGKSWTPLYAPLPDGYIEIPPAQLGYNYSDDYIDSHILVSADGNIFVVTTPEPVRTADRGGHWTKIIGLPPGASIVADRADAAVFYGVDYARGIVYVSRDGAQTFVPQKTRGLPDIVADKPRNREAFSPLIATPQRKGDLWFVASGRLYHSTDGGVHFARVETALKIFTFDFGKAPAGSDDKALYALGTMDETFAVWQSLDQGKTWVRLNESEHEYCRMFRAIAADKNVFGRVYVGTDGRGIVYGEPKS